MNIIPATHDQKQSIKYDDLMNSTPAVGKATHDHLQSIPSYMPVTWAMVNTGDYKLYYRDGHPMSNRNLK